MPITSQGLSGSLTITFDDAMLCQFEHGFPVLREMRMPGVMFVPTGLTGQWFEGEPMMKVAQLKELADAGWEIGSHTVSHPRLASKGCVKMPLRCIEAEFRESRDWLLSRGFRVVSLAYPYGDYSPEVATLARQYYTYARTCERGLNSYSSSDVRLARFNLCHKRASGWQSAVRAALDQKSWLIAMIHRVVRNESEIPPDKESLYLTRGELEEALQFAARSGIPVRTIQQTGELCKKLPERPAALIESGTERGAAW